MKRFEGKVALVTGASSGIGEALARELARQGASVALLARRTDRLETLAVELRAYGVETLAVQCDVARDGDLERAVQHVAERLGRIDVAVANAGFGIAKRFDTLVVDDYRRQFETNVFGVIRTAQAVVPRLKATRGTLAIVGSVTGFVAPPGASPYAMSKFAVRAFAESLRAELKAEGVAVVHVAPGFVDSEIRKIDNRGVLHEHAADPIPGWLRMPADVAARKIARAIARRRREAVITGHGKLAVFLSRHCAPLVAWILGRGKPYRREPGDQG